MNATRIAPDCSRIRLAVFLWFLLLALANQMLNLRAISLPRETLFAQDGKSARCARQSIIADGLVLYRHA